MKLTWACNKSTLSHWFSFSTSRMRKPNMIGSDSKIDFNTKQIEVLVWKRLGSFTTWTCLFWLNFVPRNIFNVFPLFDNVRNVSWYRFLSIVVSVRIELESMSVCRNKASNSLQTLGSSLKKNERKKERKTWKDQSRKKNELICVTHKREKGFFVLMKNN